MANWVKVASQLESQDAIYCLKEFNSKLYGGTWNKAMLFEWNGVDAWVKKADQPPSQPTLTALVEFNNKLYGSGYNPGKLYEWNGVDAWVEKADISGEPEDEHIEDLCVFNEKIYASTYNEGWLFEWNGVDAFVKKAELEVNRSISPLIVFNDKLYGGNIQKGWLLEWNGVDAWVEKAPGYYASGAIYALAILNNKLYGVGLIGDKGTELLEWNGVDAWVKKADSVGIDEDEMHGLAVLNNELYAITLYGTDYEGGELWKWNGTDAWVKIAEQLENEELYSLATFNSKLYTGTYTTGLLFECEPPVTPPIANFSGNPTEGTAPLTVQFTDLSTNTPTSWSWDFGDGQTSEEQNPEHIYTEAGTYTVSLTATNEGGSDDEVKTDYITVTTPVIAPVANFSGNPTEGTAPLTVQFTDLSTNTPTSWSWDFGDGTTSTEQNPEHIYTEVGTYTVSLTSTNEGGSDTEEKEDYITVSPLIITPVANFSAEPLSGKYPLQVHFTDLSE